MFYESPYRYVGDEDVAIFIHRHFHLPFRFHKEPDFRMVWFVLEDMCANMGLANPTIVASRLNPHGRAFMVVDTRYRVAVPAEPTAIAAAAPVIVTRKRRQIVVNQMGMHQLLATSNKPLARQFQDWAERTSKLRVEEYNAYLEKYRAERKAYEEAEAIRQAEWEAYKQTREYIREENRRHRRTRR